MTTSAPPSGAEKARLLRHTQAVARLRHPNLVRMLPLPGGAGLSPILGDAHRLSDFTLPAGTFKRFDLEQVVRLLLDVLSGLSALHEVVTDGQAFVHGQVSPQNIYVDEHGTARLVPLMNGHSASLRAEHSGYVAPERLLGATPDVRADVFSVGVMLWEALAGKRLFPDPSPAGVLARQAPPIRLGPRTRWAQPLCAIAERAISAEPRHRFQSALELSNAIAAAAATQLSRVDGDAWQEEAPTPVFQPRMHLATLRASTPEPSVRDVAPPPLPLAPTIDSAPPTVHASAVDAHAPPPARRRWGRWLAGSALAASLTVALFGWRAAPRAWHQSALRAFAAATYGHAGAARFELPPAPAKVVPPSSVSPPAPSTAPAASAGTSVGLPAAATTRPDSAPPSKPPRIESRPPRGLKALPIQRAADYGI